MPNDDGLVQWVIPMEDGKRCDLLLPFMGTWARLREFQDILLLDKGYSPDPPPLPSHLAQVDDLKVVIAQRDAAIDALRLTEAELLHLRQIFCGAISRDAPEIGETSTRAREAREKVLKGVDNG